MVPRAVQNLGRNGLLRAGQLSNGKKFFIKLAQTYDEQMIKISERYLKPLLSKGPSIKDVSPEGEGGGVPLKGDVRRFREGPSLEQGRRLFITCIISHKF